MNALAIVSPVVVLIDGIVTTTSLAVAEFFGKRHDDVLKAIRALLAEIGEGGVRNFAETLITNEQNGQQYPAYRLTRDGFTLLAMGFTGKKALHFKLAYIDAFNAMEAQLRGGPATVEPVAAPRTKKALPGCLTLDQQDAIKALVRSHAEALPADKRAKATIGLWSAVNAKFGTKGTKDGYKGIPAEQFGEVLSVVARVTLEGEVIPPEPTADELKVAAFDALFRAGQEYILSFGMAPLAQGGKTLVPMLRPIPAEAHMLTLDQVGALLARQGLTVVPKSAVQQIAEALKGR